MPFANLHLVSPMTQYSHNLFVLAILIKHAIQLKAYYNLRIIRYSGLLKHQIGFLTLTAAPYHICNRYNSSLPAPQRVM